MTIFRLPFLLYLLPALAGCVGSGSVSVAPGWQPEVQALASRAGAGDRHAQAAMARLYEDGRQGVSPDLRQAERLYRLASREPAAPEARQGYLRVRGKRLGLEAAEAGPRSVFNEIYMSRRLESDRRMRNPDSDGIGIRRIVGPIRLRGEFVQSAERAPAELCGAIESLVTRYANQGFQGCDAVPLTARPNAASNGRLFLITYSDNYEDTEEYRSFSGHVRYRAPFSSDLTLAVEDSISGEFLAFEIEARTGRAYRILVVRSPQSDRPRASL